MQLLTVLSKAERTPGLIVPRLLLSQAALDMLTTYVNTPPRTEICGVAYVGRLDSSTFYVADATDVFITEQTVTVGSAHVSGHAFALAVDQAAQDGRDDELRLQWHSHPHEAYFSDTDMEDVENFGVAGVEWFIRLVTNRDGDIRARFDRYRPERYGTEMDVVLYREPPQQLQQYVKAKVDKHVTIQPTIVHRGISFGVSTRKDTAR